MKHSNILIALTFTVSGIAFGMHPGIPTSALPIKQTTKPTITATVIQPRETLSIETALLFNAINKKDAQAVENILSKLTAEDAKTIVNSVDRMGKTPLFRAVETGDKNIVQKLLKYGARPEQTTKTPGAVPALRNAAMSGNIDLIKQFIRENADLNQADAAGLTPLMMAASQGKVEAVRLLINAGANVNAKDKKGHGAYFWSKTASSRNAAHKAEIQKLLKDAGAVEE